MRTAGSVLGTGAQALLIDWDKVLAAAGGLSLIAIGVYSAKGATGVTSRFVEARIGKPNLVTETSRFSIIDALAHPIRALQKLRLKSGDALKGVVLPVVSRQKLCEFPQTQSGSDSLIARIYLLMVSLISVAYFTYKL